MDLGINLYRAQLLRGGMVGAAWPWIQPHLGLSPSERLNPAGKKCPQEVCPSQSLLPQLLKGLTHGLELAEVHPSHSIPPRRKGNGAATSKHGERSGSVIHQVKPLLPPPLHQPRHGNVEVRINFMPRFDMNNRTPDDYQLHFPVLRTADMEDIIPQIKRKVNPQVSLTWSHEGRYVQDPRGGQVVQL
jgi:hypothetical protein